MRKQIKRHITTAGLEPQQYNIYFTKYYYTARHMDYWIGNSIKVSILVPMSSNRRFVSQAGCFVRPSST